jgi:hypothetical protein
MSSTADFLQRLRQFVQAESDAKWQALDRQWSRPLQEVDDLHRLILKSEDCY